MYIIDLILFCGVNIITFNRTSKLKFHFSHKNVIKHIFNTL